MTAPVRLIIGLGNPGPEYETTRHNAGFWVADHIADDLKAAFTLEKSFFAWTLRARIGADSIILAKPISFMNRSGQAVGALARFYKIAPEEVLVIHDELDFMPGVAKLKFGGGHAGHNGLRDIQSALSGPGFWRLRIGIGHPRSLGLAQEVVGFVLNPPRRDELKAIEGVIDRCRAIVPALVRGEFDQAINQLHKGNP